MNVWEPVLFATLLLLLSLPGPHVDGSSLRPCSGLHFDGFEWSGDALVPGSGTAEDPYLVHGMEFDLRSGDGLAIDRSSAWVVVSYCRFAFGEVGAGISVSNSSNVSIDTVVSVRCQAGLRIVDSSGISVANATMYGGENGIECLRSTDIRIVSSLLTYNDANGMTSFDSSDLNIKDCSLDANSPRLGSDQALLLSNCSGTVISNTTFRMNYGNGITIMGALGRSDLALQGCALENNVNGIFAIEGAVRIANASFISNTHGVLMRDCTDSLIRSSFFKDNENCITIYDSSYIGVEHCTFSKNANCVRMSGSSSNWVIGNEFRNNTGLAVAIGERGKDRDGSEGNLISRNIFLTCTGTKDWALDMGCSNRWFDCVGGNYWSDHQGPDGDDDGIVDLPRSIGGMAGSIDMHPMVFISSGSDENALVEGGSVGMVDFLLPLFDSMLIIVLLALSYRAVRDRKNVSGN